MFWRVMIGPQSRFSDTKKIPDVSLDQTMNLDFGGRWKTTNSAYLEILYQSASGSVNLNDSVTIMKSCKWDLTKCKIVDEP